MHISLTRRSGLRSAGARLGAAALAAVIVVSGLATGTAAADTPLTAASPDRAQNAAVLKTAAEHGKRQFDQRAKSAAAAAPADCRTPSAAEGITMTRYAGASRYTTAVCASHWTWAEKDSTDPIEIKAEAVVLARGDAFPDALAGGPLAGYVGGPLLLTTPNALLPAVEQEIKRVLKPGGTVYLLGGTGSLSAAVNSRLVSQNFNTVRLAGADRYTTAIRIAQAMPTTNTFFVTTGTNFPDALAAGTYAATYTLGATRDSDPETLPVALLFSNDARMPASTGNFIAQRAGEHGNFLLLYTAGGAAQQAATNAFGANVVLPFTGADRYRTAALIADGLFTTEDTNELVGWGVGLASGTNFPDALAGTSLLMLFSQPLLLTNPTSLSTATRSFLQNHAGEVVNPDTGELDAYLDVFGGTGAVSSSVANAAFVAFS